MKQHDDSERPNEVREFEARLRKGGVAQPDDAAIMVDRATALAHEMGNLIDGSMRSLNLARQTLDPLEANPGESDLDAVRRRLGVVYGSLERMGELVHGAMRGAASSINLSFHSITLGEALEHAAEVCRPIADEHKTSITVEIEDRLSDLAAGPVYPVILNGLRNAIESIVRVGGNGSIQIRAASDQRDFVILTITDDGIGMPEGDDAGCIFMLGCTSKREGLGLGLAICRDIAELLGGDVDLLPREDPPSDHRPGVILRFTYPISKVRSEGQTAEGEA